MQRLLGLPLSKSMRQDVFLPMLRKLRKEIHVPSSVDGRLEAMDLQNCLCEFDKYCRAVHDGGRPRRLYP